MAKTRKSAKPKTSSKPKVDPKNKKTSAKKSKQAKSETNKSNLNETNSAVWKNAKSIFDFTVNDIDKHPVDLSKYKGNVCLIVNVASRCGYTSKNYKEMVELYEKFKSKPFKILAFPCNQFGKQEPGTNEKIKEFCQKRNVQFDLFDKINVNGDKADALWCFLRVKQGDGEQIKWNFCKFLVDKNGLPVERFLSKHNPLSLVPNIEKLF